MLTDFELYTEATQGRIRSVIQHLQKHTFIIKTAHDPITGLRQENKLYTDCELYYEFIRDYFSIMNIHLNQDVHYGLFYIEGDGITKDQLSQLDIYTILLLHEIFRNKYMASDFAEPITNWKEIREQGDMIQLFRNEKIASHKWIKTFQKLRNHHIIEIGGSINLMIDETPIYIYPTLNILCASLDVPALLQEAINGSAVQNKTDVDIDETDENLEDIE